MTATKSRWQALPTEAINPASLAIDKLDAGGIVDLMLAEDRRMLAAVHKERDRIALGRHVREGAAQGRAHRVRGPAPAPLGIVESAEMPPTFGTSPSWCRASWPAARTRSSAPRKDAEDNYEEGARAITRLVPTKKDVVVGVSASGMTRSSAGPDQRAQGQLAGVL